MIKVVCALLAVTAVTLPVSLSRSVWGPIPSSPSESGFQQSVPEDGNVPPQFPAESQSENPTIASDVSFDSSEIGEPPVIGSFRTQSENPDTSIFQPIAQQSESTRPTVPVRAPVVFPPTPSGLSRFSDSAGKSEPSSSITSEVLAPASQDSGFVPDEGFRNLNQPATASSGGESSTGLFSPINQPPLPNEASRFDQGIPYTNTMQPQQDERLQQTSPSNLSASHGYGTQSGRQPPVQNDHQFHSGQLESPLGSRQWSSPSNEGQSPQSILNQQFDNRSAGSTLDQSGAMADLYRDSSVSRASWQQEQQLTTQHSDGGFGNRPGNSQPAAPARFGSPNAQFNPLQSGATDRQFQSLDSPVNAGFRERYTGQTLLNSDELSQSQSSVGSISEARQFLDAVESRFDLSAMPGMPLTMEEALHQTPPESRQQMIPVYWLTWRDRIMYEMANNTFRRMGQSRGMSNTAMQSLLETMELEVYTRQQSLRQSQSALRQFFPNLVHGEYLAVPVDAPVTGGFETQYQWYAENGRGTPELQQLNDSLPKIMQLASERAATANRSLATLENGLQRVDSGSIAPDELQIVVGDFYQDTLSCLETLRQYNSAISDYTLTLKTGAQPPFQLARMLVPVRRQADMRVSVANNDRTYQGNLQQDRIITTEQNPQSAASFNLPSAASGNPAFQPSLPSQNSPPSSDMRMVAPFPNNNTTTPGGSGTAGIGANGSFPSGVDSSRFNPENGINNVPATNSVPQFQTPGAIGSSGLRQPQSDDQNPAVQPDRFPSSQSSPPQPTSGSTGGESSGIGGRFQPPTGGGDPQ